MLVKDEIAANRCANISTSDRPHPHGGLLAACLELITLLISTVTAKYRGGVMKSKTVLDLNEAQTIFGIDRDILLTAMVNHELPSSFTANGHRIKYKDLEQFVDRYYYQKNPILGNYCPKL